MLIIHSCRRVVLDAVQWRDTFAGIAFIAMLIWFIPTSLVSYTKKEIMVITQKSMQVADEKLTINTSGSDMAITSSLAGQVRPEHAILCRPNMHMSTLIY